MLEQNKINTANSSVSEENLFWKKLWKLTIPPKVKVFWWRVMHNYVPVNANLKERHIENQGTCPDRGVQDETVYHALITCTFATMFWRSFHKLYSIKLPKLHPVTWCFDLLVLMQTVAPFYVECGQFGQRTMEDAMGKQK
jgi:hypothetical protein